MNENRNSDIEGCVNVLREIADLCENASLAGSYSGGAGRVVLRYNTILADLRESGLVKAGMFDPLPESAGFGEIGVEARMLAAFVRKDRKKIGNGDPGILMRLAPFISSEDLSALVRKQIEAGAQIDMHMLTHLAPFMGKEELGYLLRDHLSAKPAPPAPPEPAPAPQPAATPAPVAEVQPPVAPAWPQEDRVTMLLERLKDPRLSDEERTELVDRIRVLTSG